MSRRPVEARAGLAHNACHSLSISLSMPIADNPFALRSMEEQIAKSND
jgi:hypothetical protein